LDAVLDASDDAVLIVEDDASGARVRLANRAFVALFALRRSDLSGSTEAELQRVLRDRGSEGAAAAKCLAASVSGPSHDTVTTEGRTLALRGVTLTGAGASPPMRMLLVRDVTAEHAAQSTRADEVEQWKRRHESAVATYAALRALHDDVETRLEEAGALNTELRTLDGMKSELLANVSHELQTPLVSIRGYTEMILKGRLGAINDEQRKGLALSLKNIDRLIAMIDNLLAFARTDRESGALSLATFPLLAVIDEALQLLAPRIEEKGLRVTRQVDDAQLSVRADRDKILQIFLNLIGNAVKFNRERGSIDVTARRGKPGFALVQVADTGVGIAKDDLEKVFDRFYQASDGLGRPKEGSGIGLAIVRNILRLHGCVIHATSEPGEGTVLSFTLPLAGEKAEAPSAQPPDEPDARRPKVEPVSRDERPRLRIIRRG
jgi:signal transduction histidine kinase